MPHYTAITLKRFDLSDPRRIPPARTQRALDLTPFPLSFSIIHCCYYRTALVLAECRFLDGQRFLPRGPGGLESDDIAVIPNGQPCHALQASFIELCLLAAPPSRRTFHEFFERIKKPQVARNQTRRSRWRRRRRRTTNDGSAAGHFITNIFGFPRNGKDGSERFQCRLAERSRQRDWEG